VEAADLRAGQLVWEAAARIGVWKEPTPKRCEVNDDYPDDYKNETKGMSIRCRRGKELYEQGIGQSFKRSSPYIHQPIMHSTASKREVHSWMRPIRRCIMYRHN
jgi:hypothetical protein